MSHRSDPELILACQRGEKAAWDLLVDRYARLVYSIPRRQRLSDSDADDVFASVWATVFKNLDQLRDNTRLSAWLITTTHRESWRVARKRGTHRQLDDATPAPADLPQVQTELLERQHLVRTGLQQLGGRCEELLTALYLSPGEPSYDAIASRLGMPVGSIGPTRARCFQKLQTILQQLGMQFEE